MPIAAPRTTRGADVDEASAQRKMGMAMLRKRPDDMIGGCAMSWEKMGRARIRLDPPLL
jgi:hypothetical protein